MVLCRYDDGSSSLDAVRSELDDRELPHGTSDDSVTLTTVHDAKGREAAHVIVVDAVDGPYGFPPDDRTNDLLAPVQPIEMNTIAEERRLFYVAITRSKNTLDIITRSGHESRFTEELAAHFETVTPPNSLSTFDEVGMQVTFPAKVDTLFSNIHPKKCQYGRLVDATDSMRFVSWKSINPPILDEGTWYLFEDARVNEYKGELEIKIAPNTDVRELTGPPARSRVQEEQATVEPDTTQVTPDGGQHQVGDGDDAG